MHLAFSPRKIGLFLCLIGLIPFIQAKDHALDANSKTITLALSTEPPKLNPLISTDAISFMVLNHITEGLMAYNEEGELSGGVAKKWQLRDDGASFWLREDARWNDGTPVTAHDFVFAWQSVVKPETASSYAFILYPVKNAEAINKGEMSVEKLGVRAMGDHRLEVTFQQPTAYFLDLTAFISYRPIKKSAIDQWGRAYASDADTMLFNGPFILTEWVHGASLRMEKNPHYWQRDKVTINTIDIPYITSDSSALFNLFQEEKIATWIKPAIGSDSIKKALKEHMPMRKFQDGSVFYIEFNHRPDRVTANKNLRKAIQSIFDASIFTNKVISNPGNTPAYSIFPDWLKGYEKPLAKEYPPKPVNIDFTLAKMYVERAKKQLGVKEFPPLILLIDDGPGSNKQGEYLQTLFADNLGLDIKLDKQIFKLRLAKSLAGDFDLLISGWGPDFNDPMTFADLFASWNLNNRGRYSSKAYDKLVRFAQSITDNKKRAEAFGKMQQLLQDDVVLLPMYQRGDIYLQHARLTHVVRSIFGGDPVFTYARITPLQGKD